MVALATVYGPRWIWFAWNCCLSYLFMWTVLIVEIQVRRHVFAVSFSTSGSSSSPKTIVKTFSSLAREVAYHAKVLGERKIFGNGTNPVFISTVEDHHMYGILWRKLLPRATGCESSPEVVLAPETLLERMRSAEKVFLVTTPSFLAHFAMYADQYEVPQNCVEIVTSGALLEKKVSEAARRIFGIAPLEIFGSTETGGVAWRRQGDSNEEFDWKVFDPVKVSLSGDGCLVIDKSPFSVCKEFVMGDGVVLSPDARSFKLLGRKDRVVKIAENRISLPDMETEMRKLPEISDATLCVLDGLHGPYLGAVVVLSRIDFTGLGKRTCAREIRRVLTGLFPPGTVPRRYRFVPELPVNAQGKIPVGELKKILESEMIDPFASNVVRAADSWSADFTFPHDASYFSGHFPAVPILPGVVQLGLAHRAAERLMRRTLVLVAVKKMKFMRVIRPGDKVYFTIRLSPGGEMAYSYSVGDKVCSSGILVLRKSSQDNEVKSY